MTEALAGIFLGSIIATFALCEVRAGLRLWMVGLRYGLGLALLAMILVRDDEVVLDAVGLAVVTFPWTAALAGDAE